MSTVFERNSKHALVQRCEGSLLKALCWLPYLADQLKSWTNYRLNDRLDRVERRTQRAVEAVLLGHESR